MSDKRSTFVKHLEELRSRIIKSIVFVVVCSVFIYARIDEIMLFLAKPVGRLIFIAPQEAFVANLAVAFFGGLFFASPFVVYQIWQFISAGLSEGERKYALIFGCLSFVLFITGCLFGYFIIIPIGIKLLMGSAPGFITPMITVSNYISFLGVLTFLFGLVFQLPLAIVFLARIGVVDPKSLSARRREVVVIIFIVAAILTPPDVFTQIFMAAPLIVLYELGIFLSKFVKSDRKMELLS